ncbi:uncharacterized protein LOC143375896 [Andrena cerasifolii]|uniref:uncharacterized protein LOC143375896 n=1 Tax=Andrena cerasifolii TaxID=2819439 RepID=UPI004038327C
MPPKIDLQPETTPTKTTAAAICNVRSPGPKYQLKTLVGHPEHCISKYRNPAYTFGTRLRSLKPCVGPGPKYLLVAPRGVGFTIGRRLKSIDASCSPGPKYNLPGPKGPAFSIKFRTKPRGGCFTPGPSSVKPIRDAPVFSIGVRIPPLKCDPVPGPYAHSINPVTPNAPKYSIAFPHPEKIICRSPGPKYELKFPQIRPMYSFGVKHSECAPPYIVECDDQC